MIELMIAENNLTFKDLEKNIFNYACGLCQEITRNMLEDYDKKLCKQRDKSVYRHKGIRKTVIKTIYGEVTYKRAIYEYKHDGKKESVYLLDEALELGKAGTISANLVSLMVDGITEMSYKETASQISKTTGQSISPMGVWNVIQKLGELQCEEEKELVDAYKKDKLQGEINTHVIFEESDGVFLGLQGKDRKDAKGNSAEMKVGISYTGWKETSKGRFNLKDKAITVGFYKNNEFQICREARIASKYNLDEVKVRVLNSDGAAGLKNVIDETTIIQLDPFHRNKAIKERIHDKDARKYIYEYLKAKDVEGLFDFLESYKNSISDDKEIEDAETLLTYFKNNKEGLIPYQERGIEIPVSNDDVIYRNLGTMEANIWLIVARRMKHNHCCWSKNGANHLVKIIAKKCCDSLEEVIESLNRPIVSEKQYETLFEEVILSADANRKIGHGYEYPVKGHFVNLALT